MASLRGLPALRSGGRHAHHGTCDHRAGRHDDSRAARLDRHGGRLRQSHDGTQGTDLMKLDPITLEIMATKVAAVSEEMGYTLQRTGRTLYVKATADFGTALAARNRKFFSVPNAIGVSGFV